MRGLLLQSLMSVGALKSDRTRGGIQPLSIHAHLPALLAAIQAIADDEGRDGDCGSPAQTVASPGEGVSRYCCSFVSHTGYLIIFEPLICLDLFIDIAPYIRWSFFV